MTGMLKLDISQVKEIIKQFSDNEKQELTLFLNKLTIEKKWLEFVQSKKGLPISEEEILEEVEFIRSKSFEK